MPQGNVIQALLLTLFAGLATGLGAIIVMFAKKFSTKTLSLTMGFSAGVMILVSFVELFSDARNTLSGEFGDKFGLLYTLLAFFGGMALIAIIDFLVPSNDNPHEVTEFSSNKNTDAHGHATQIITAETINTKKTPQKLLRVSLMSTIVIAIHNFPEGIATFVSAMDNITIGLSIAFAIALHNIPEGIAIAIPTYYATGKKSKAIINATLSGLAEPCGAILAYLFLSNYLTHTFMGVIFAVVAGIMVYISLDELLPTAENYGEHHLVIQGVIAGMAFMGFGLLLFL